MPADTLSHSYDDSGSESGPSRQSDSAASRETSTTGKRYVSAPFVLQGPHTRRGPTSELVVVETPPSHRVNPTLTTRTPPLQLRPNQLTPQQPQSQQHTLPAALPSPTVPQNREARLLSLLPTTNSVLLPQALMLRDVRAASEASTGATSTSYTPLTNASAPSLPYTWTDSYLEESPEATRARWLNRQTFGPVLQSEGGASSTIASTPRGVPQDGEKVWGGVLARNAEERQQAAAGNGNIHHDNRNGGGKPARRFNLEAAERGGDGLGRASDAQFAQQLPSMNESAVDFYHVAPRLLPGGSPAAKNLFPANGANPRTLQANTTTNTNKSGGTGPKHLLSDVSTVIATVQQPKRAGQITSVERHAPRVSPPTTTSLAAPYSYDSVHDIHSSSSNVNPNYNSVKFSVSATMLPSTLPPNAPELRTSRDVVQSRPSQISGQGANPQLRSGDREGCTSITSECSRGDVGEASSSDIVKDSGGGGGAGMQTSRNIPLRMRVLKPIYDD